MAKAKGKPAEVEAVAEEPKKGVLVPMLIGVVLAAASGGGAFYGVFSGMIPVPGAEAKQTAKKAEQIDPLERERAKSAAFVDLDPVMVGMFQNGRPRQIRLTMTIETERKLIPDIQSQNVRILDAVNTLVRAVDERDFTDPAALDRLRAQLLRRIQLVVGPAAKDLLIVETVIL